MVNTLRWRIHDFTLRSKLNRPANFRLKLGHQLLINFSWAFQHVQLFPYHIFCNKLLLAAKDNCCKRYLRGFDTFSHSTSLKHRSKSIWKHCWAAKRKGKWPSVSQTSTGCRWRHRPCQMPIVIFYSPQEKQINEVGALCGFAEHRRLFFLLCIRQIWFKISAFSTFLHSTRLLEKGLLVLEKRIINKKKVLFSIYVRGYYLLLFCFFFSKTEFSKRRLRTRIRLCMYNIGTHVLSIGLQPTGVAQPPAR